MESQSQSPFYLRLCLNLISLCLIGIVLIYGKSIIVPLTLAVLFANLLLPITRWLNRKGIKNRPLSILIPLIASIIVVGTVIFLLSIQVANFVDDVPALSEKGAKLIDNFQQWVDENAHIAI